jgi:Beta-lactamase
MKEIIQVIASLLPHEEFDALGVGVIDFSQGTFQALEATQFNRELQFKTEPTLYFDLASLTKVLTNSLSYFLKPEAFTPEMLLALSHHAGLPSWGRLSRDSWKELILSYTIKDSATLYSDFSALRVLLEFNKTQDMKSLCQAVWDKETMNWLDLPPWFPTLQNGYINSLPNFGRVHDPNAFVIGEFCSHAGMFSTVDGLCRTLINYQSKTSFIEKVKADLATHTHRFSFGWDRVENPQDTLAGLGCGKSTFGHLGFTGTSIWIDPDKMLGHVILTNATKYHWYNKTGLNDIRRALGQIVWRGL